MNHGRHFNNHVRHVVIMALSWPFFAMIMVAWQPYFSNPVKLSNHIFPELLLKMTL